MPEIEKEVAYVSIKLRLARTQAKNIQKAFLLTRFSNSGHLFVLFAKN